MYGKTNAIVLQSAVSERRTKDGFYITTFIRSVFVPEKIVGTELCGEDEISSKYCLPLAHNKEDHQARQTHVEFLGLK